MLAVAVHVGVDLRGIGQRARKTQANHSALRQVGQVQVFRQAALKFIQPHGQGRLDDADDDKGAVLDVFVAVERFDELGNNRPLHHRFGLVGHAWHGDEDFPMVLEPHDGRCTHFVLNHRARRGHHGLRGRVGVQRETALFHDFGHIGGCRLVVGQLAAKIAAQGGFRDVVLGRTQAACHEYHIGLRKSLVNGVRNLVGVIGNHMHVFHVPAKRGQVAGNPARIGVGDLPDEQFVTDNDN